jgi:predicted GH43/DUF377 family glycosyl hydrolase
VGADGQAPRPEPIGDTRYRIERLGVVLQPDMGRPEEVNGVLNPAVARDPSGALLLFPRLVGGDGVSRVGRARLVAEAPAPVERLGIALAPEEPYERKGPAAGGCEDPRITYVEPLRRYILAYTALGRHGPTSHWPSQRIWPHGNGWGWCVSLRNPPSTWTAPRTRMAYSFHPR